jgi:hypothetical protein
MSHLIEEYAKSCGVDIGVPIIKEHFYPIVFEKFITLHVDSKDQARSYSHWSIVLQLLSKPLAENGIKVIQIGSEKTEKLPFVDKILNNCSYKNSFYIIKKSLLHLGINSLPVHVASAYNKKIVNIFGNLYPECAGPYWSDKKDIINLAPDFSKIKPTFSLKENPKRIDEIKPEVIANAVLKLLNIKNHQEFESVYFGHSYKLENIEVIPKGKSISITKGSNINLRMDKHFSLEVLSKFISQTKLEITTDKPIPVNLLIKEKIKCINYISDSFDGDFINEISRKGIKFILMCTDKEKVSDQRLKNFDHKIHPYYKSEIIEKNKKKIGEVDFEKLNIFSRRKIICEGKQYNSYFQISEEKEDLFLDLDWLMCYYASHE